MASSSKWIGRAASLSPLSSFVAHVVSRFREERCDLWAAMLCYVSLLGMVPLMAVMLAVVSGFSVFEGWTDSIQTFIFENFVPSTGRAVETYVDRFVERASQLSAVGVVFLVVSALLLMQNIDMAFNRIWRVSTPRSPGAKLVTYWTVLSLGPLLMSASVAITSYVASLPLVTGAARTFGITGVILAVAPFLISALTFSSLYVIVPNTSVSLRHALTGGLVAAVLFEIVKTVFAYYVANFPAYEAIYGALAAIPAFLVWVYLSWLITLAGATVAAALRTHYYSSGAQRPDRLFVAFRLIGHLWDSRIQGRGLSEERIFELEPDVPRETLLSSLTAMQASELVRKQDGTWLLSVDVSVLTILDLMERLPAPLPRLETVEDIDAERREAPLATALSEIQEPLNAALRKPIREFLEPRSAPED